MSPMKCPKCIFGSCNPTCMDFGGDVCNCFHPPKPLTEILTIEERLERLEQNPPSKVEVKYITLREDVSMIVKQVMSQVDKRLKGKKVKGVAPF